MGTALDVNLLEKIQTDFIKLSDLFKDWEIDKKNLEKKITQLTDKTDTQSKIIEIMRQTIEDIRNCINASGRRGEYELFEHNLNSINEQIDKHVQNPLEFNSSAVQTAINKIINMSSSPKKFEQSVKVTKQIKRWDGSDALKNINENLFENL